MNVDLLKKKERKLKRKDKIFIFFKNNNFYFIGF